MMSICEPGRKASTPTLTMRPPLTTDLTLPLTRPPSWKTLTILSQFCLWAAFSFERTTMPSSFSRLLEEHFDLVADFDFLILELVRGDGSFGFVADVHEDNLRPDFEDGAFDDRSFAEFAKLGIDEVNKLLVGGFRACVSHGFVWFGVVLFGCVLFLQLPRKGKTDRHRGANRLSVERKTDAETSFRNPRGKAKAAHFQENPVNFRGGAYFPADKSGPLSLTCRRSNANSAAFRAPSADRRNSAPD